MKRRVPGLATVYFEERAHYMAARLYLYACEEANDGTVAYELAGGASHFNETFLWIDGSFFMRKDPYFGYRLLRVSARNTDAMLTSPERIRQWVDVHSTDGAVIGVPEDVTCVLRKEEDPPDWLYWDARGGIAGAKRARKRKEAAARAKRMATERDAAAEVAPGEREHQTSVSTTGVLQRQDVTASTTCSSSAGGQNRYTDDVADSTSAHRSTSSSISGDTRDLDRADKTASCQTGDTAREPVDTTCSASRETESCASDEAAATTEEANTKTLSTTTLANAKIKSNAAHHVVFTVEEMFQPLVIEHLEKIDSVSTAYNILDFYEDRAYGQAPCLHFWWYLFVWLYIILPIQLACLWMFRGGFRIWNDFLSYKLIDGFART
ncbi:unnamed protein product [Amoebophrya sp. A25]|nr:unnamed protein product [Amoebophrya sp. A25]|eukprot:GSA25T00018742001.1